MPDSTKAADNESIIARALKQAPELDIPIEAAQVRLSRWRSFVGEYTLPALRHPVLCLHLGSPRGVRFWSGTQWSEQASAPSRLSFVPAGLATRWQVNGELDVAVLSLTGDAAQPGHFAGAWRFSFVDPLATALIEQLLSEHYREIPLPGLEEYRTSLARTLLDHLARGASHGQAGPLPQSGFAPQRLHHVMQLMSNRYSENLDTEFLATEVGLNPSYFCQVFKRATGQTPRQYLLKLRVRHAKQSLGATRLPISLLAQNLGFSSQSHFTHTFKRLSGMTPAEYRARVSR